VGIQIRAARFYQFLVRCDRFTYKTPLSLKNWFRRNAEMPNPRVWKSANTEACCIPCHTREGEALALSLHCECGGARRDRTCVILLTT